MTTAAVLMLSLCQQHSVGKIEQQFAKSVLEKMLQMGLLSLR